MIDERGKNNRQKMEMSDMSERCPISKVLLHIHIKVSQNVAKKREEKREKKN